MNAAIDLFRTRDWSTVSIEDIAARADVGKGTIYKHFDSKDDIFACILIKQNRSLYWELQNIVSDPDFVLRLGRVVRVIWKFYAVEPEFRLRLRQHCEQLECLNNQESRLANELAATEQAIFTYFEELIRDGISQGVVPDQNQKYMLILGVAVLNGVLRNRLSPPMKKSNMDGSDDFVGYVTTFLLRGWGCNATVLAD